MSMKPQLNRKTEMFKTLRGVGFAAAAITMATVANALPEATVQAIVGEINETLGNILVIGAAVLSVYVAIKAFKWIRRSL